MAFIKNTELRIKLDVANAYHKITNVEIIAMGTGCTISCTVSVYKSEADSKDPTSAHNPLEQIIYRLGDFDPTTQKSPKATAYELLAALIPFYSDATIPESDLANLP